MGVSSSARPCSNLSTASTRRPVRASSIDPITAANPNDATLRPIPEAAYTGRSTCFRRRARLRSVLALHRLRRDLPMRRLGDATLPASGRHSTKTRSNSAHDRQRNGAGVMSVRMPDRGDGKDRHLFWSIRGDPACALVRRPLTHWRDAAVALLPRPAPSLAPLKAQPTSTLCPL